MALCMPWNGVEGGDLWMDTVMLPAHADLNWVLLSVGAIQV